jgi:hypothetical protein
MTASRDPDRMIHHFLREGEEQLQDQVYDAVRAVIEQKRQRAFIGPWRTPNMNRFVTVGLGSVAVIAVLLVGAQLFGGSDGTNTGGEPTTTPTAELTATPEPSPSVAAGLPEGPHLLWETEGVAITVTIAAPRWEAEPNQGYLCWTGATDICAGPPDGAGIIAFADPGYYVYGDPCNWSSTRPDTAATTVDELVDALANQASREASAPEDITVDGYAGKKIILNMADEVADIDACDEGQFALFGVPAEDPARFSQGVGQVEELWIVDVDGLIVVLDGGYYADTPQNAVDEVRALLASATFELP